MIRQGIYLVPTLNIQGGSDVPGVNFRRFLAAGGRVAMGDDAGFMLPVGFTYHDLLYDARRRENADKKREATSPARLKPHALQD